MNEGRYFGLVVLLPPIAFVIIILGGWGLEKHAERMTAALKHTQSGP